MPGRHILNVGSGINDDSDYENSDTDDKENTKNCAKDGKANEALRKLSMPGHAHN